jgi:hypothetical protein
VAGRDDRDGVPAVCSTHRTRGARIPNLRGDLSVGSRLSKRDRQQRVPHLALKRRSDHIQFHGELLSPSREVFFELTLGFQKNRMAIVLDLVYQLIVFRRIYPLEAIDVAILLAIVPYFVLRGPVNRVARRWVRPGEGAGQRSRAGRS